MTTTLGTTAHELPARSLAPGLLAVTLALYCAGCGTSRVVLSAFRTEQQAQEHCPRDTVVWLDPQSGLFELKGHGSYGISGTGRCVPRRSGTRGGACRDK